MQCLKKTGAFLLFPILKKSKTSLFPFKKLCYTVLTTLGQNSNFASRLIFYFTLFLQSMFLACTC